MTWDRQNSTYTTNKGADVLAGQTIAAEGAPLITVADGAGGVAVRACTGAGGEKFAGFSRTDSIRVTTDVIVESITIPLAGGIVNLQHANIVAASGYAYDETAAAVLTQVVSPPGAGQCTINVTNGTIEFNVADASDVVTVSYRYNLTLEESKMKFRNSLPNNIATDYFGRVGVMGGQGNFFTDQYNTAVAYAALGTIYLGANGLLTSGAGGTAIGFCTQVPGTSNGYLGVEFTVS